MPERWRPNDRVTFRKWRNCAICCHPWPEDLLRVQNGRLVCPEDYDEPSHEDIVREATRETEEPDYSDVWERD